MLQLSHTHTYNTTDVRAKPPVCLSVRMFVCVRAAWKHDDLTNFAGYLGLQYWPWEMEVLN